MFHGDYELILRNGERLALIETGLEAAGPDRVIAHIGAPDARRAARLAASAVALGATRIAAIAESFIGASVPPKSTVPSENWRIPPPEPMDW